MKKAFSCEQNENHMECSEGDAGCGVQMPEGSFSAIDKPTQHRCAAVGIPGCKYPTLQWGNLEFCDQIQAGRRCSNHHRHDPAP